MISDLIVQRRRPPRSQERPASSLYADERGGATTEIERALDS
jgi:hypothetical protein